MQVFRRIRQHPLITLLGQVQRNAFVCIVTEPMWGIPYYLYQPFCTLYMAALGIGDAQIGLVLSISSIAQFFGALLGGTITDKLGRRRTCLIFGLTSWSLPTFFWAAAQNVWWFVVAALCFGTLRINTTAWNLLLTEDENPKLLVPIYTCVSIASLLSAFFAPASYLMVQRLGVILAMRILFGLACASMTTRFILEYVYTTETHMGVQRMDATRGRSITDLLKGIGPVLGTMLRSPKIRRTIALSACFFVSKNITDNFWPLLVTSKLGVSSESLSMYAMLRFLVMLVCCLTLTPRVSTTRFRNPMLLAFGLQIAAKLVLIFMPKGAAMVLVISVLLEALSLSVLNPLVESLQMTNIDPEEKARMLSILVSVMLLCASPFGYIAGLLSQVNRVLPFLLTLLIYGAAILLALGIWRIQRQEQQTA